MTVPSPPSLHILEPSTGGVPRYVQMAVASLRRSGARADTVGPPSHTDSRLARVMTLRADITQALGRDRQRVVHIHSSFAAVASYKVRDKRSRPATVFQPHAFAHATARLAAQRAVFRGLEQVLRRDHDVVACLTEDEADEARLLGYGDHSVVVVGSAVDVEWYAANETVTARAEALRRQIGLSASSRIALFVGRSGRQKGSDRLRAVADRLPSDSTIVTIGLERPVAHPRIVDGGVHRDLRPWYMLADVLVQPSRWEGLSLASLEAGASGRPVVTFDVSGASDVVAPGCGAIVPQGDTSALAAELSSRLADRERVACEGEAIRKHVATQFSQESLVVRLASAYDRALLNAQART